MKHVIQILVFLTLSFALYSQGASSIQNNGRMERVERDITSIPGVVSETSKTTTTTTTTTTNNNTNVIPSSTVSQPSNFTSVPATNRNASDPNKPALFINSKTAFELVTGDDLSGVDYIEYKINDGEFSRYTIPITLSKEGPATITYKATDKVGNREGAQVINIIVDNTAPQVTVKSAEPLYVSGNTSYSSPRNSYQLVATDAISGVKQVVYSVDNDAKQEYKNQPIKIEKPGFHVINFYAVDNAGNISPENSFIVNIDGIKPTVEIKESMPYIMINGKRYAKKETVFTLHAFDGQSGIKQILVRKDGETDFVPYVEPLTFGTSGEHVIEAKAVDNVGNESDIARVDFSNDIKAPSTIIKAVSN